VTSALRERLGWQRLEYAIPAVAHRLPYMLGGLTFICITLLIVTGLLLDQFYNPNPLAAHDSVLYIMTRVPFGQWLRALHYWAAVVAYVSVFLHIIYVFWRRSYGKPREVTWWAGVGLFITVFALVFTGTVLRADQEGGEALAHAVAGAKLLGGPGAVMTPEFTPSTTLLTRMHNAHVSLLPILLLALVALHFWLIRGLGINSREPKTMPFTHHLRKLTGYGLLLVALIGAIAALFPPGIGHPVIEGVEVTKPFWPFLWIYSVENTIGLWGMVIAPLILFGFLFAVPLLDRGELQPSAAPRPRWLFALALVLIALYVGGIVYGVFAPQMQHIGM
jgi:ubiquinol-cytochrome c reductase cytochrome b subunit